MTALYKHNRYKPKERVLIVDLVMEEQHWNTVAAQKQLCCNGSEHRTATMGMGQVFIRTALIFSPLQ